MKTANFDFSKTAFGVAVSATEKKEKKVVVKEPKVIEPLLIANTTMGKFTITAPVVAQLGLAEGDSVMFVSNVAGILDAIENKTEFAVKAAEQLGVDLDTEEGKEIVIEAATQYFIARGFTVYNENGEVVKVPVRLSKEYKIQIINDNRDVLLEQYRDKLTKLCKVENPSDDDLLACVTNNMLTIPTEDKVAGSVTKFFGKEKTETSSLSFFDALTWKKLKNDVEGDIKNNTRIFAVEFDSAEEVQIKNGSEYETVKIFPINFLEDKTVVRTRAKKEDETVDAPETEVKESANEE